MEITAVTKKILVVEDEELILQALVDTLVGSGFVVFQARDGVEGLELALRHKPDLILLDLLMPRMDGIEMMDKLRAEGDWGKSVPIILLTNLSHENDRIIAAVAKNQPAYYLVKTNMSMDGVLEKVRERINRT